MSATRFFPRCAALAIIVVLAACGGGTPSGTPAIPPISSGAGQPTALDATPANIYVSGFNGDEVDIFNGDADGNVEPVRHIINGGNYPSVATELPFGLALDESNNLYVAYFKCDCFEVFPPNADGAATPVRKVIDPALFEPNSLVRDAAGDTFLAALAKGGIGPPTVNVYPPAANGNTAPIGRITIPVGSDIMGLAFDPNGRLYVSVGDTIYIFAAGTCGPASPIAMIEGSNTELAGPKELAFDSSGVLYVANVGEQIGGLVKQGLITEYAPGATGNVAPLRSIAGPATLISNPWGVAVDQAGRVYAADLTANSITVYAPGANGDVAPIRRIAGHDTRLVRPNYIIVH